MNELEENLYLVINQMLGKTNIRALNVKIDRRGADYDIKLIIDSDSGVNIDNCAFVSRITSDAIKVNKLITGDFNLEVSSPGINRPLFKLEDYLSFVGENVKMKLNSADDNRKNLSGRIVGINDNQVVLEIENVNKNIDFHNIKKANIIKN
tara:strand:+ start:1181 stop:1633 length:453 start_codon:yes stop_codon:yes gene_type:complete